MAMPLWKQTTRRGVAACTLTGVHFLCKKDYSAVDTKGFRSSKNKIHQEEIILCELSA